MLGSTPATSQLDWLISTTAMIVLSWSKATRDLLKSFGWGIRALHQLVAATMVPSPRRLPHTISPLEGDGFELPVPQQIHSRFRVRARSIGMHRKVRFRSRFRAGGRWIPSVPGKETTLVGRPRSIPRNSPSAKETVAPGTDGSNPPPSRRESAANLTPADAERHR